LDHFGRCSKTPEHFSCFSCIYDEFLGQGYCFHSGWPPIGGFATRMRSANLWLVFSVLRSSLISRIVLSLYIFKDTSDYQWKVILIEIDQIESVPSLWLPIEIEKVELHERFRRICHRWTMIDESRLSESIDNDDELQFLRHKEVMLLTSRPHSSPGCLQQTRLWGNSFRVVLLRSLKVLKWPSTFFDTINRIKHLIIIALSKVTAITTIDQSSRIFSIASSAELFNKNL
jgi:hypothetical protein